MPATISQVNSQLSRIENDVQDIKQAIRGCNINVPADASMGVLSYYIDQISNVGIGTPDIGLEYIVNGDWDSSVSTQVYFDTDISFKTYDGDYVDCSYTYCIADYKSNKKSDPAFLFCSGDDGELSARIYSSDSSTLSLRVQIYGTLQSGKSNIVNPYYRKYEDYAYYFNTPFSGIIGTTNYVFSQDFSGTTDSVRVAGTLRSNPKQLNLATATISNAVNVNDGTLRIFGSDSTTFRVKFIGAYFKDFYGNEAFIVPVKHYINGEYVICLKNLSTGHYYYNQGSGTPTGKEL